MYLVIESDGVGERFSCSYRWEGDWEKLRKAKEEVMEGSVGWWGRCLQIIAQPLMQGQRFRVMYAEEIQ